MRLEDLERAFPFFTSIGTDQVEVAPIGSDFGKEVVPIAELLAVKKLVFEAVDRFDVTLPGVALRWNEAVI